MPRLRLKTKLVLAITAMVLALVIALSWIYISQLMRQDIRGIYENAGVIAHEVLSGAQQALEIDLESTRVDLTDPKQVRTAIAEILQSDPGLNSLLQSVVGYSPTIYDVSIVDQDDRAMLHTDASLLDKKMPTRHELSELRNGPFSEQIKSVYGAPRVYEVRLPIQLRSGAPFGEIRVGVSTVFLKNELQSQLNRALIFSAVLIFISLLLAAGVSDQRLYRWIDR